MNESKIKENINCHKYVILDKNFELYYINEYL